MSAPTIPPALEAELVALVGDVGAHLVVPLLRSIKAGDVQAVELNCRVALAAATARRIVAEAAK